MNPVSINYAVVVQPMSVVNAVGIYHQPGYGLLRHAPNRARPPSP